jgi:hypothetical protein
MIGPIRLYIKSDQTGGNPNEILQTLNTDKNNFLFSRDKKYIFQFNNEKNIYYAHGSHFLSYGSNTAVFSIIDVTHEFKNIILKLTDESLDEFLTCIEKYNHDKQAYGDNIMTVHMWGILYDRHNNHIANFMIVKEYKMFTSDNIKSLQLEHKLNMIYNFTLFLAQLTDKKVYLRDIKMPNIGFDIVNGKHKIVIIDYDNLTTLDNHDVKTLIKTEGSFGIIMSSGTYVPYYLIENYIKLNNLKYKKDKFSKINKIITTKCNSVEEAKIQTLDHIIKYGKYSGEIVKELSSIYNKHTEVTNLADDLSLFLSNINYSEYQSIVVKLTTELDKVVSVPLAILIATLLYEKNPIEHAIKLNEHANFENVLTQKSPSEYESSFLNLTSTQSLLENTNDNLLINTILKGLLKAQHNEILSYNQVIELMNNLTYFKTDNAIFELSPDSVEAGKYKIQKHSSIVTANNPASIYDVY